MLIIGIAGGTGCGKTTMVNNILKEFPNGEVIMISQDAYYKDTSHLSYQERVKINFDHPKSIDFDLLTKHLSLLKSGETIQQPVYSFIEHNRTGEEIITPPRKVIIIEGILILTNSKLREIMDIKIFIHANNDERLVRRIKRDIAERGRDIDEIVNRYMNTLKPMHDQYIEPMKEYADIIIPNNKYNDVAVNMIKTIINDSLIDA